MRKYNIIIIILAAAVLMASCRKSPADNIPVEEEQVLLMSLFTRGGGSGDLVLQSEDSFSSLAVYIFSNKTGGLEYAELIEDFSPESRASSYTRKVHVSQDEKAVYAIANYVGKSFNSGPSEVNLSETTTKATLDALEVTSTTFAADGIVMVGKQVVPMTGTSVNAEITMERLVGRMDVYVFKSSAMADEYVELVSVEFCNQTTKSNVQYGSAVMPTGAIRRTASYIPASDKLLTVTPGTAAFAEYTPADADVSFYGYQNVTGATTPDDSTTPYLLVTVNFNGIPIVYRGDLQNGEGKYNFERNKVYRIKAVIGMPNDRLLLRVTVLDWNTSLSAISFDEPEFTLEAVNTAAETGSVSSSSPATYTFTLEGPVGAVWTASLTNGLEFAFSSGGDNVSSGIARTEPYTIGISPRMSYSDDKDRQTGFYIMVNGERAVINPAEAEGNYADGRKYPGTDTDILIKQTK